MNRLFTVLVLMLFAPGAAALTFTEDFEGFDVGDKPGQTWYSYDEADDVGFVHDAVPVIGGTQSMKFEAPTSGAGSHRAFFDLAGPAQLSSIEFTIEGVTIADDGVGSEQVITIGSVSPERTLVSFFLFCSDADNPTGCELRVKWQNVDTTGQVLINATAGDDQFIIQVEPNWNAGTFDLTVDAVDDGTFPFLELPSTIGRVTVAQQSSAYPFNVAFDDWTIDGATDAVVVEGQDIAQGIKSFARNINFTNEASLFLLGLVVLAILVLAVAVPLISLGLDNTVLPSITFFVILAVFWLIGLGWWPQWVGIALIIITAALIALVIRQLLMGIKDASTNAGIVAGSLGYFIIATSLLGFSGYATESIEVPNASLDTQEDIDAMTNASIDQQSFLGAVTECVITFFSDCSQETTSKTWATITNVASTIFNFARTAFTFLFQLLKFSLPIPVVFNAMIVLPPAAALATVGFSFITKSGS